MREEEQKYLLTWCTIYSTASLVPSAPTQNPAFVLCFKGSSPHEEKTGRVNVPAAGTISLNPLASQAQTNAIQSIALATGAHPPAKGQPAILWVDFSLGPTSSGWASKRARPDAYGVHTSPPPSKKEPIANLRWRASVPVIV